MLPQEVTDRIESHLGQAILQAEAVGGGCISNATHIKTDDGDFFLKWSRDEAAATFPAEAAGLVAMRKAGAPLVIPQPLLADAGSDGSPGMLLMPWIRTGSKGRDFSERFGRALAEMHRHAGDRYGFHDDNFIGRLPQQNGWEHSWPAFFRRQRLEPQVDRARRTGRWDAGWNGALDRLYDRLTSLLPEKPEASILHGDLWGGNYMVDAEGRPVLIDPAAYYGHREADLAMTELFGGFDGRFYEAYREAWPLDDGYAERRDVYNLYHLINHLNHFGGGYAGSVARILREY